ncbi:MAG TPA: RDD family protein [Vicinamibacterales bacterium]|jgi:uncharacterized RDD family membrane protein YckC|nr:RDD family protein [Vicinamibacterales bacterium]
MKCPKCLYIGFETGDRCKNCGYDFSLLGAAEDDSVPAPPPELPLRQAEPAVAGLALDLSPSPGHTWTPDIDRFRDVPDFQGPAMTLAGPADLDEEPAVAAAFTPAAGAPSSDVPALPLFMPDGVDDEPLVRLPATPRTPLAVRRTPDTPRLRPMPPVERSLHEDAVLQFVEEPGSEVAAEDDDIVTHDVETPEAPEAPFDVPIATFRRPSFRVDPADDASPFGRRATAAIIDHGILLGIDLVVLYFTLRLTDLTFADWRVLPWLPLAAFLLSVKVAYLSAFTTAGGQTIGKMATHIRVVSEDGGGLDPGRALRRAVLELASIATAGAPFLTAIADPLRRGVHDRASGTRVVALSPR